MTAAAETIRQNLRELADQLPADAMWDEVIEEARFRKAVQVGIAAAERGAFARDQEVRARVASRIKIKSCKQEASLKSGPCEGVSK
ncbi:hypothetical protein BH20PSE1_BH20PSE1_09280 [soil metagenome]